MTMAVLEMRLVDKANARESRTMDSGTEYTLGMPKCLPGCACRRHQKHAKPCSPGCSCARHVITDERRANISAALAGRALTEAHKSALRCPLGCTCGKHTLQNTGQFQPGSQGFTGSHTDETRAKLATYTGERASSYKHGWSKTPTYSTWASMRSRCRDRSNASWEQYGGRGITVCRRWDEDFLAFLADMGVRPSLEHSIDRIDVDGNYEPGNCRWLTRAEQNARRKDPGGWQTRRRKAGQL